MKETKTNKGKEDSREGYEERRGKDGTRDERGTRRRREEVQRE